MTKVITDVVYIDGKKERFTSESAPSIRDGVLTNQSHSIISSATSKIPNETVFGIQMSEVRRYSYRVEAAGVSALDDNHPAIKIATVRSSHVQKVNCINDAVEYIRKSLHLMDCNKFAVFTESPTQSREFLDCMSETMESIVVHAQVNYQSGKIKSGKLEMKTFSLSKPETATGQNFDVSVMIGFK